MTWKLSSAYSSDKSFTLFGEGHHSAVRFLLCKGDRSLHSKKCLYAVYLLFNRIWKILMEISFPCTLESFCKGRFEI